MPRAFIIALFVALAAPTAGHAYSGLELLRGCSIAITKEVPSDPMDAFASIKCAAYIAGIVDANTCRID